MGFISSVGHFVSKVAQGASDTLIDGPLGPVLREELESAQKELNGLIHDYQNLSSLVAQYEDPINNIGKYTSSLLHQSSDFVHGIAVNYDEIIKDATLDDANIRSLPASNVIKPLLNIPIPGTMGGIPSALIPGVESLKMVEGLINLVGSSITLSHQLNETRENIRQARTYISHEQSVLQSLKATADYLLQIDNEMITMFQRTCGVALEHYAAGDPSQLNAVAQDLPKLISTVTNLKGNAFRTIRFIQNVIKAKSIKTFTAEQMSFIVEALMKDDQIAAAFTSSASLHYFVSQFVDGSLIKRGMLTLPPIPNEIKPYINEQPPEKQTFSDPNSSAFDPPSSSLDGFPM